MLIVPSGYILSLSCTIQLTPAVTVQPPEASTFVHVFWIISVLPNQNDHKCNCDAIDGRSVTDEVCLQVVKMKIFIRNMII